MKNELQFLMYSTPENEVSVNAIIKDETIWLTQKSMADLFGVGIPAISKHLKNIFEEGELIEEVVVSKMEITTQHGAIPNKTQFIESDFDREVKKLIGKAEKAEKAKKDGEDDE